jgi:hypothetical protein
MIIKNILLFFWQFPQNLLGFILKIILKAKKKILKTEIKTPMEEQGFYMKKSIDIPYYEYEKEGFLSGVSLGRYILLPANSCDEITIRHEYGHQIQSQKLGIFYLLTVGIVSAVFNNLWDRIFHKNWTTKKRYVWYYSRWPENWADRLGNVIRNL